MWFPRKNKIMFSYRFVYPNRENPQFSFLMFETLKKEKNYRVDRLFRSCLATRSMRFPCRRKIMSYDSFVTHNRKTIIFLICCLKHWRKKITIGLINLVEKVGLMSHDWKRLGELTFVFQSFWTRNEKGIFRAFSRTVFFFRVVSVELKHIENWTFMENKFFGQFSM